LRRSSIIKKTDVTRVTRAVIAAGLDVVRIQLNLLDGTVTWVAGKPGEGHRTAEPSTSIDGATLHDALDRELAEFEAQHDQG
jgi:hypothetical protein